MINYGVHGIKAFVGQFRANGVTVLDESRTYGYGKLVYILDPAGNTTERWKPVDHIYTAMGGPTTK